MTTERLEDGWLRLSLSIEMPPEEIARWADIFKIIATMEPSR